MLKIAIEPISSLDYSRYRTKFEILFVILFEGQVSESTGELDIKVAPLASEFIAFWSSVVYRGVGSFCHFGPPMSLESCLLRLRILVKKVMKPPDQSQKLSNKQLSKAKFTGPFPAKNYPILPYLITSFDCSSN